MAVGSYELAGMAKLNAFYVIDCRRRTLDQNKAN